MMRTLLAFLLAASVARAQSNADALFTEGVEQLRTEHYAEAATAFRESYRLDPNVTTMCNLALTYDRWGTEHREQAVRAYRTCAEDDSEGRFREHAADRAVELERELALEEHAPEPEPIVTPPPPPPRPDPIVIAPFDHAPLWTAIAPAALSVAALAIAIGLAIDAQQTVGALMQELGDHPIIAHGSPEEQRLLDAETKSTWANGLYVASGILAAGAVTLAVIDLVLAEQPRGPITPRIDASATGFRVSLDAVF